MLADERLARDRHYLASARRFAPHTRSEPEEEMLAERDPAAAGAWHTLFDQVTSTLRIPFDGEDRTIDEVLARVRGPARETRLAAYEALFTALEPQTPVLAHVYDSLVADRLVLDRVRGYEHPRESRDLDNELPSEAVDVLLAAVERHHHLAHRWFRHKAKLLGLEKLSLGDQYAPLGSTRAVSYDDATSLVARALDDFSPRIGAVARGLYRDHRIDAEPRPGKRGGAFCASIAQDALPYIMLNFTDQMDDVRTLAHEIGHAMQFQLAGERQTALSHHPPLALAEVPSTFAEMIVTDRLLAAAADDTQVRLGLLATSVETAFATVFRQTHMVRYEQGAYGLRAEGKALMPDRLGEIWLATNRPYYGDAVELPDGLPLRLGLHPALHPHALLHLRVRVRAPREPRALRAQYREDGDAFVGPYLDFLSIGGAASPQEQLAGIGLDISRDDCWDAGFAEIERLIEMAEAIEPPEPGSLSVAVEARRERAGARAPAAGHRRGGRDVGRQIAVDVRPGHERAVERAAPGRVADQEREAPRPREHAHDPEPAAAAQDVDVDVAPERVQRPPAERVRPAEERPPVVGRGAADAREAPVVGPLAREREPRLRPAPAREAQLGRAELPELARAGGCAAARSACRPAAPPRRCRRRPRGDLPPDARRRSAAGKDASRDDRPCACGRLRAR